MEHETEQAQIAPEKLQKKIRFTTNRLTTIVLMGPISGIYKCTMLHKGGYFLSFRFFLFGEGGIQGG